MAPELDGVARRTSPLTVATGLLSLAGAAVVFGAQYALTGSDGQPAWLLVGLGLFLLVRGVSDAVGWVMRTYSVTNDRLVIDEGVLTRHHRVVPFERVQQVDISQDLVGQALGLAAVRIDSAGEGGTTVHLKLLSRDRADGLRSFVLERRSALQSARAGATAPPLVDAAAPPPAHDLLRTGPGQLAISVLAGPLAVAGAVLLGGAVAVALVLAVQQGEVLAAAGVVGVALLATVGLAVLAVTGSVLSLWDLTVSVVGDDLRLSHGLLQVRNLTLPRRRVQHVTVVDGPLQHALGFVSVTLHSAAPASGAAGNQTAVASRFTIPYVRRAALPSTLHTLLGGSWDVPELTPRGPAARRRASVRRAGIGALVVVPTLIAGPAFGLLVAAGGGLGWVWGMGAHRRAGSATTADLVVLAHGVLVHRIELVPSNRVQSGRTSSSPLQRRVELATIHLDLAGGGAPHLYDMAAERATELCRSVPRHGAVG